MHSMMVMVDGGDALADDVMIDLINAETLESIKGNKALHEEFFRYLIDVEESQLQEPGDSNV